jgi:hypothetical protein
MVSLDCQSVGRERGGVAPNTQEEGRRPPTDTPTSLTTLTATAMLTDASAQNVLLGSANGDESACDVQTCAPRFQLDSIGPNRSTVPALSLNPPLNENRATAPNGSSCWTVIDRPTFRRLVALRQRQRQRANAMQLAAVRQFVKGHRVTRVPAAQAPPASSTEFWRQGRG